MYNKYVVTPDFLVIPGEPGVGAEHPHYDAIAWLHLVDDFGSPDTEEINDSYSACLKS